MQLIKRFWKQLIGMIRDDSRAEKFEENPSIIALKKHMLFEGNFNKDIKYLYALGRSSSQPSELEGLSVEKLWEKLWNLHCLLSAWEDSGLDRKNKKERHALKYKKDLDKPIRRAIHKALRAEADNLIIAAFVKIFEGDAEDSKNIVALNEQLTTAGANEKNVRQLIELTAKCLRTLKIMEPDLKSPDDKDAQKRFKKAANAITSFKTLQQKILASLSISVAVIAALACGFFTGGFIYVLLGGFGVATGVAIGLAALAGLFGFTVNVRFFSKSLPEFLLKLTNLSRVTEFINEKGEREQFTNLKKYVYLPLAALSSVAVGIAFAAFSMAQFAAILVALPFLAATGPLPIILAAVLAITMTIVMFKAFVEIAPKLSFSQLKQSLKTAWKEMSFMKFLSYGITLAVCGMGIFGLAMACHAGLQTLVSAFGGSSSVFASVFAYVVLATSFAGQLPFNILTVSTFCKVMGNFLLSIPKKLMSIPEKVKNLFRQTQVQSDEVLEKPSFLNKVTSAGHFIWESMIIPVLLFVNAIANGAGIMIGKPSTSEYVAGAAGALNSISGNLVSDNNAHERSQADNAAIRELKASLKPKDPLMSDNKTQEESQVDDVVTATQKSDAPKVDKTPTDNRITVSFGEQMSRPSSPLHFNRAPVAPQPASEVEQPVSVPCQVAA